MKLSIVTLNYNDVEGLTKTFNSIIKLKSRSCTDIEFIIVDGGSIDGSLQFIEKNIAFVDCLLKDKNKGIYFAMNDGIKIASGDYLVFMNGGDYFVDDFILDSFLDKFSSEIVFGYAISKFNKKEFMRPKEYIDTSIKRWWDIEMPCHQATFIPKNYYEKNKFDTSLKICADSEYLFKAFYEKTSKHIEQTVCVFQLGGISSQQKNLREVYIYYKERKDVHKTQRLLLCKLLIKFILQKILGNNLFYKIFY